MAINLVLTVKHLLVLCTAIWLTACLTPSVLRAETAVPASAPDTTAQEWPSSSPAMQGMDAGLLVRLRQQLISHAPAVRSVVVIRHGHLVFEHYAQGVAPDDLQRINSVTKSVVSALVGIALDRGQITSVEQPLSAFVQQAKPANSDPAIPEVTIENLLTMTAGFEWDEQARDACLGSRTGACARFAVNTDLVSYALHRPLGPRPGKTFNYDSHSSHLLSALLTKATGLPAAKFAEANLFGPMGIQTYRWDADAEGNNFGGSGLYLRSRDLAKFGQLYLDRGAWRGRQLVSAEYVKRSTTSRSDGGWPGQAGYGFQWWVRDAAGSDRMFFAQGYGGQYIMVYPHLDMVVVITSDQAIRAAVRWIALTYLVPAAATK